MTPSLAFKEISPPVPGSVDVFSKHRRLWVTVIAVVALFLTAGTIGWRFNDHDGGLAGESVVRASSTALGFSARDVVTSGSATSPGAGWQSDGETSGAWIELTWPQTHVVRQIVLVRGPLEEPGVTDGFISFGDGSYLQLRISQTSRETVVRFSPRSVDKLRFTASGVSAGAKSVFLAEILVNEEPSNDDVVLDDAPDGNAALHASVTASSDAGASDPHALVDGSGAPGAAGLGADWTASRPAGAWVQLDWSTPQELSSVQLVGARSAAKIGSATLTFGDGSELPVGAVLDEPERPTTVSFMPRVTNSVRLTIDRVSGTGTLSLGELRTYQREATPARSSSAASSGPPIAESTTCDNPTAGTVQAGMVVRCPLTGSAVAGRVDFQISAAAGYSSVTATLWPADAGERVGNPVRAALNDAGAAELTVDVTGAQPGPLTVAFEATGTDRPTSRVYFQLYRSGGGSDGDFPSSAAATGRTLAYAEEFERPVSLSRTGIGADYAGAKPTFDGSQDFGDAYFSDDVRGFDNVRVVDNRYLRMDVEPITANPDDAAGGATTFLGGMLASARQGGSGFSAQYGYFEARILAPAAPGTWPAFWMLPSDNLVAPTPKVAEIDAVELYGHDPVSACHSTHGSPDNTESGGVALCGQRWATARAALAWHTYGVSITPSDITYYIDGRVVASAPQVGGGGAPMFFLVDLQLGGGWPVELTAVQDRAELYVDYVRVYV